MRQTLPRLLLLCSLLPLAACGGPTGWDGRMGSLFDSSPTAALQDRSPEALYAAGIQALQEQRYPAASQIFEALEREHPFSTWATNAKIMAAYSDYMRNRYTEAIGQLDRFIQLHPAHRDIAYARDARLKMDLARDHLAGREMNIGRFYQRQRLFTAAIGRYRRVVENYQTTNHVPEALHRLTEIYLSLGLRDEAARTASVLGHNFPGSAWYQDSYALLTPGAQPAEADRPGLLRRAWGSIF